MTEHAGPKARWGIWLLLLSPALLAITAVTLGTLLAIATLDSTRTLLIDAGPAIDILLPPARIVVDLASAGTIGALVLAATAVPARTALSSRLLDIAAGCAAVWALAALGTSLLAYFDLAGPVRWNILGASYGQFLTEVALGQAWLATVLMAAGLAVLAFAVRSPVGTGILASVSFVALIPLALQGHAAGAGSHSAATTALWMHTAGAAVWVGGLAVTAYASTRTDVNRPALLQRYSTIALIGFIVVALSGVVSAALRLAEPSQLFTTDYGRLLLVKIIALLLLGAAGAAQRRWVINRLVPSLHPRRLLALLVTGELTVMGVASGAAAILARTAPPVTEQLAVTAAQRLSGQDLPLPLEPARFLDQWAIDPIWLTIAGFGIVLYAVGVRRLRKRGDRWHPGRTVSWISGLLVLVYLTNGAPSVYGVYLFSSHMLEHMALSMLVPILLVLGAPITLAMRTIPPRTDNSQGAREWIMSLVHSPLTRVLTHPLVAAVLFAGSTVAFYYTPLFDWAVRDPVGHQWMIAHFLVVGYLFALSLIGIDPVPYRFPYPLRLLTLLIVMAFHAFFGLALMSSNDLLLPDWYGVIAEGWTLDPLADQRSAGGIAWSVGEIPTLALVIVMITLWSRADEREARRLDRRATRSGDVDLADYNAMLRQLGDRDRNVQR
ncbi:copper resistance protein D [Cnuibacter physcomitrellae]|uniref:Uncharacterized protein n=1 Tax=Cnuibacter physcomitrellae TaxID=1619308 RepID=A0A1X9LTL8_9MICO|nr:cytochrome c oxidase assembly protein [Cnuibacter physcomitrellae]ARJ07752.1 hypothetical protein B5808_20365 [Cnuibacter physcomitrellae]GGI43007.1 copper resistance protein D [Cnuibacter physcomitrellae]